MSVAVMLSRHYSVLETLLQFHVGNVVGDARPQSRVLDTMARETGRQRDRDDCRTALFS